MQLVKTMRGKLHWLLLSRITAPSQNAFQYMLMNLPSVKGTNPIVK